MRTRTRVMLHVFPVMLQVFLVMLHVGRGRGRGRRMPTRVMLHVFPVMWETIKDRAIVIMERYRNSMRCIEH